MKRTQLTSVVLGLCLGLVACEESVTPALDGAIGPVSDVGVDASADGPDLSSSKADVGVPEGGAVDTKPGTEASASCKEGTIECIDPTHQRACRTVGSVAQWVVEPCGAGTLCLEEQCSATCKDQCNLGETRPAAGGKTETCKLFSVAGNGPVPLSTGMHDRARSYNAHMRAFHLAEGAVRVAFFTDSSYTKVAQYHGMRDSALFTGLYLAAEALRFKATGSPDAQKNLQELVETVHRLFQVHGHKGYLARFAAPMTGGDPLVAAEYDPSDPEFHKVTYQGKDFYWRGNTSRDAHQGPLLGFALAYEALTSEPHKQMIRQDIVGLCTELIKERKQLTVVVRFNLGGQWIKLPVPMNLQYVTLNPSEFVDGHPAIQIGSEDDPSDYGSSSVTGMREFFPDYAVAIKQIPLLGSLITFPIPRSGSTIMLSSILRLGMLVTQGVPQYSAEHAAISAHYKQKINGWIGLMKLFTFMTPQCWEKYYGLNITFTPMYNLMQMETDPTLKKSFGTDIFEAKMWPYVKGHKNVYFSYIFASQAAKTPATQAVVTEANAQLKLFPPAPNVEKNVDNTGKYPANPSCENQSKVAIDVSDRQAAYFLWEKHPFYLKRTTAAPNKVLPGEDYLIAYWMGRAHGLLADDAEGTCLRWLP